eukprot:COSAG01_NODE_2128_length_8364_cov_100.246461_7_plen_139_part_00
MFALPARPGFRLWSMEHGVDYELQAVDASTSQPLPVFWVKTPNSGPTPAPHVCSRNGLAYRLIVHNNTDARIAVKVRVDSRSTLPPGACFVVRPVPSSSLSLSLSLRAAVAATHRRRRHCAPPRGHAAALHPLCTSSR